MRIMVKNLGPLCQAEFELGELTIICGKNNTGKTYATYALLGFLSYWRKALSVKVPKEKIIQLLDEGTIELDINNYLLDARHIIKEGCIAYSKKLPDVFASSEKNFTNSEFFIDVGVNEIHPTPSFEIQYMTATDQLFSISKGPKGSLVTISLIVKKEKVKIPHEIIAQAISDALKEIIFEPLFPNPFIASAERTGTALFRNEINFAKNRLLDQIRTTEMDIAPPGILTSNIYSYYALPVKSNIDFTRRLEEITLKESFITELHPKLLDDFADIIGGDYSVTANNELYFVPKGDKHKLTVNECSSAVRSLLILAFFLRHAVKPNDILIVDEPELNLHPENQRRVARLFAALVNIGIKIFITTHSDYIIKELNTLIMLNSEKPRLKAILKREGYNREETLSPEKVRVYIAEEALVLLNGHSKRTRCQTLTPADVDPELGIEVRSFDITIDEMNRIQEEIIWGD